jgi:hypothetical protein
MIILQLSHSLALISSCTNLREAISEKHSQAQDSTSCSHEKPYKAIYPDCIWHSQARRFSKKHSWRIDHHLHSHEGMFLEDLPMRERLVKSPSLRLTFSSSSELEELSLKKSKSLRATHARDMIL